MEWQYIKYFMDIISTYPSLLSVVMHIQVMALVTTVPSVELQYQLQEMLFLTAVLNRFYQSGAKPNLVAKILATKFGVFCDMYNAFKNMFDMSLMIMY